MDWVRRFHDGGVIYAALQGNTKSSGSTLSGSVREFDLRNGSIASTTYTGTVTLPASPGCSGTLTPRASGKNIFNLRMTFIGPNCALGNGATASGVAVYDNGALLAMGLLPSQTAGFIFTGRK